ncbi:MAG: elongation factor P maturation arginine rhamnosyltransferase EarP [Methylotenera sp.]|nr:elongation factor P maturation arginine rhamnosyltransferase EarP [Methylotenera sp.]
MTKPALFSWDVFCKIVDNHGDIGICWRLCRQLASEQGLSVRLFVDDWLAAKNIIPQLDPTIEQQSLAGVTVCAWPNDTTLPSATVLETLSCGLPQAYLEKMVAQQAHWINLEYLSAEDWVASFHGKPSPQAQLPITRHFFFPGFELNTGGLIREASLLAQSNALINNTSEQARFWQTLGCEQTIANDPTCLRISLFCYPQANIKNLLESLQRLDQAVTLFFPASLLNSADSLFPDFEKQDGQRLRKAKLSVQLLPFLSQTDYDRLLWSCDLNFVRGEDSWVRAIWAGQPFIWQPYLQNEGTHLKKMQAFLQRYTQHANTDVIDLLLGAHNTWSDAPGHDGLAIFNALLHMAELKTYAAQESDRLAQQPDLASKLLCFSENLKENKV